MSFRERGTLIGICGFACFLIFTFGHAGADGFGSTGSPNARSTSGEFSTGTFANCQGSLGFSTGGSGGSTQSVANETWFALAAGLSSILSLLLGLYTFQVKDLPPSLYRSLQWGKAMKTSVGFGVAIFSGMQFYTQEPPGRSATLFVTHCILHGGPVQSIESSSGPWVWAILFSASICWLLIITLSVRPEARVRTSLLAALADSQRALLNALAKVTKERSYEQLGSAEKELHLRIMNTYSLVEASIIGNHTGLYAQASVLGGTFARGQGLDVERILAQMLERKPN